VESRLFKSLALLFTNPGKLSREYIHGKRTSYYKPFALFALTTAIYLLVRSALDFNPLDYSESFNRSSSNESESILKEAAKFMVQHINNILFVLILSYASISRLFFGKTYSWAELTVPGFYTTSLYIMIGTLFMVIQVFAGLNLSNYQLLVLFTLLVIMNMRLYNRFSFSYMIRYLLGSIITLILYALLGFSISLMIIWLKAQ
jgi:hypothetical protein